MSSDHLISTGGLVAAGYGVACSGRLPVWPTVNFDRNLCGVKNCKMAWVVAVLAVLAVLGAARACTLEVQFQYAPGDFSKPARCVGTLHTPAPVSPTSF